jgi:hypothetical protein
MRAAAAFAAWCAGCTASTGETHCDLGSLEPDFRDVSEMIGAKCGSLDCHGQVGRPLRLYSGRGLRLAADDTSGHGGTRSAEHEANFSALTGLEPELICDVVGAHGRDPERLTVVRKALGREAHKGGAPIAADSAAASCLLDWLNGRVPRERCKAAAEERPE